MKQRLLPLLLTLISCGCFAQESKYLGAYHSNGTFKRGIISSITFSKDSFVISYVFLPEKDCKNLLTDEGVKPFTGGVAAFQKTPAKKTFDNVKKYKGTWHIDNGGTFAKSGWDYNFMADYNEDSVIIAKQHFTDNDGDRIVLNFNDGNIIYGFMSVTLFPSTVFFCDYVLGESYTRKD